MERGTIGHTSLRDRVRERLAGEILEGRMRPGDPIRLQHTARELGVSMTPLREGLIALEREGLVTSASGRGFSVAPMDVREVNEVYPLISLLEAHALAQEPPAEVVLRDLRELNERMKRSDDARERVRLDHRWHAALLSACSNELLLEFLDRLRRRARRYELAYMTREAGPAASVRQHDQIIEALEAGDIDRAIEVLRANWRAGPEFLVPWLQSRVRA